MVSSLTTGVCLLVKVAGTFCANPWAETKKAERRKRYFNHIKTNYNYSINQKFGVGTSLYAKRSTHTFLLMVGAKYTSYKETLDSDDFEKTGVAIDALSPDYGLMYSLKRGWKKYFFTVRTYLPLYPWPAKGSNPLYLDGNMNNISLELGIGVKIR